MLQEKIDLFSSINIDIDENAFNEILAGIEMEGFRKGLRTGIKLCCELIKYCRTLVTLVVSKAVYLQYL